MRHLVISDLHANWQALAAVIDDSAGAFDDIWCLGDLVGYGADPERVVRWVRDHANIVIRGNHDRAAADTSTDEWSHQAVVQWIRQQIGEQNRAYLAALPAGPVDADGCILVHGSQLDEDAYIASAADLAPLTVLFGPGITFFGHTHKQGGFIYKPYGPPDDVITTIPPLSLEVRATRMRLHDDQYWINPGSVGQPRDRDPRAAYLIYDSADRTVEFRRTPYDIASAQRSIRAAGLPEKMARRLEEGL